MRNWIKQAALLVPLTVCGTAVPVFSADQQGTQPVMHFEAPKQCVIRCLDPHPGCVESQKVIETLRTMFEAAGREDMDTVAQYLSDDCTGFTGQHKLIVGKAAILAHIKNAVEHHKNSVDSPLLSYTIKSPYAEVNGNSAVVTYNAFREYGGAHPRVMQSHSTDIFERHGDKWLETHYRNDWKEVSGDAPKLSESTGSNTGKAEDAVTEKRPVQ